MEERKLNIVVADDSHMVCESLAALLEKMPATNKVYLAYDGKEAVDIVKQHPIDLALLDVRMPIMDGLQAAKIILKEHTTVKVIGMTSFDEEATLLDLLRIGVDGILLKRSANLEEITKAINQVMEGKKYYNADIQQLVNKNLNKFEEPPRTHFSPRELEILRLTCEGKACKEIAVLLDVSVGFIENYRKEMLHKTKVKNGAELVAFAHRNGIV